MTHTAVRGTPVVPDRSNAASARCRRQAAAHGPASVTAEPVPPDLKGVSSARAVPRLKLLRFPAIQERTGLSRSTIHRLETRGDFPRHHRISPNAVAWIEEEVIAWLQSKVGPGAA
jgi:prophage regulatory protein